MANFRQFSLGSCGNIILLHYVSNFGIPFCFVIVYIIVLDPELGIHSHKIFSVNETEFSSHSHSSPIVSLKILLPHGGRRTAWRQTRGSSQKIKLVEIISPLLLMDNLVWIQLVNFSMLFSTFLILFAFALMTVMLFCF